MPDEAGVITFPCGLPAFEGETRFTLERDPAFEPIVALRSCTSPDLRFFVVPVRNIEPDYVLEMASEDLALLGFEEPCALEREADLECLAILAARQDSPFTANLSAPVVINRRTLRGLQAVRLDARYSHCHPLPVAVPCS